MANIRSTRMEMQRAEFFEDILAHSKAVFMELGICEEISDQAGTHLVQFICDHWGGQYFTIPLDYKYKVAQRDWAIYQAHRGDFSETARKFGITERGARKIIDRVRKRLISKNQGKLFD